MMYYGEVNCKCPFYVKEADKSITCEGLKKGQLLAVKFKHIIDKQDWQENNCFKDDSAKYCLLAKALSEKYNCMKGE